VNVEGGARRHHGYRFADGQHRADAREMDGISVPLLGL
jgi:hypothetical protein